MPSKKGLASRDDLDWSDIDSLLNPYLLAWRRLTPFQRLQRCWKMRKRLKDVRAIHDAKYLPEP
jgi:hypothetical protein